MVELVMSVVTLFKPRSTSPAMSFTALVRLLCEKKKKKKKKLPQFYHWNLGRANSAQLTKNPPFFFCSTL